MWSDNQTRQDLINFQHLIRAVTKVVRADHMLPVTIGVFGDWGSGKSSLMGMVENELQEDEDTLCIQFNGWAFEGYEDAKSALMGTILDELTSRRTLSDHAKNLARQLFERINWFRLIGMAGKNVLSFSMSGMPDISSLNEAGSFFLDKAQGLDADDAQDLTDEGEENLDNVRRNVREFRSDFAELLDETEVDRLVVFIDDLDRCLPDTVISTLEAIRLFLFVDHTAFIIGADERLVEEAVKRRFPEVDGSKLDIGRNYLEKLVQVPVRIPPLGRVELETYINLLFAQLHLSDEEVQALSDQLLTEELSIHEPGFSTRTAPELLAEIGAEMTEELKEDLQLAHQISDVLASGLEGNPRQTKRFLNTLVLRIQMAETRGVNLRRRVLAKLMLMEYLRPESFRLLAQWQAEQEGSPEELNALEKTIRGSSTNDGEVEEDGVEGIKAVPTESETAENEEKSDDEDSSEKTESQVEVPKRASDWLDNNWLREWLLIDPPLAQVDLRPYFFFAREEIGVMSQQSQRLSRPAREVLELFLSSSDAETVQATERCENLSEGDAATVFKSLSDRVRRAEDQEETEETLDVLLKLAEKREELLGEAVAFLGSLSAESIPIKIPLRLHRVTDGTPAEENADALMLEWGNSSRSSLAQAANTMLEKRT